MEQTNRTILFEEINPERAGLINFIFDDRVESLSDRELLEIHNQLEISSFDEVFDKFSPALYLLLNSEQKQVLCTNLSSECQPEYIREVFSIKIDETYPLLRMFLDTLSAGKTKRGTVCTPDKILKNMFPIPEKKEFIKDKNVLVRHIINHRAEQTNQMFEEMLRKYDNSIFLITAFLSEASEYFGTEQKNAEESVIVIDETADMQVKIFRCSEHFYQSSQKLDEEQRLLVMQVLDEKIKEAAMVNKELWKELLTMDYSEENDDMLAALYQQYSDYYIQIINKYWSAFSSLMEALLGIYLFFEQYQAGERIMPPKLVVANVNPEMMVDVRNRKKLSMYLGSTNQKSFYKDTIWYGIIPRLEWKDMEDNDNIRERFKGRQQQEKRDKNSAESVKLLAELLADYKIQVFISPGISRKATNRYIAEHGVDEWMDLQLEVADREHASYIYPCIPNFTVMPSEHAAINVARQITALEWGKVSMKDEFVKVWLKTIGIEASYVAAGLFAACQCPGHLKEFYKGKVSMEFPGVGYGILKEGHNTRTLATSRMDVFRYKEEIKEELERKHAGIIFAPYRKGSMIISDKSAAYLYGRKDNLSNIQSMSYMERSIRFETQDFKDTLIKTFFQNRPGSLRAKWGQDTSKVNSVLKDGESIEYSLDDKNNKCTFEICFQDEKKEHVVKLNK